MSIESGEKTQARSQQPGAPSPEEIRTVYQCHTLAQILYGQIAMTCPWAVQTPYAQVPPMAAPAAPSWAWPFAVTQSPMGRS